MIRRSPMLLSYVCVVSILLARVTPIGSMRILAIETIAGKSHWNFFSSILRVLSDNGHHVTVFTPLPDGDAANYTEFDTSNILTLIRELDASYVFETRSKLSNLVPLIMNTTRYNCQLVHGDNRMKNILNYSNSSGYDMVIEEIAGSECSSYVAARLNIPLIYVIPSPMILFIEYDLFGHVSNPATVPNHLTKLAVPKTFFQRFESLVSLVYTTILLRYKEWTMVKNNPQPFDSVDPIKPSLVFTNTHYITEAARPFSPNHIQIGGIHLKVRPLKGIPKVSTTLENKYD